MIALLGILACVIVLAPLGLAAVGGAVFMLDENTTRKTLNRQAPGDA